MRKVFGNSRKSRSRVAELSEDESSDNFPAPMENERVGLVERSLANPILVGHRRSLVPRLVVVIAVNARDRLVVVELPLVDGFVQLIGNVEHFAGAQTFDASIVGFAASFCGNKKKLPLSNDETYTGSVKFFHASMLKP